ncbi:hypothetical protein H4219_001318 [Mycoemilia scoparia]|uniref:Uncharacterized protein n=1 Tax=Mycoemilia scoparia TaxID=417184 RepID=A0A9W8A9W4_9FUNG|nr:hypothetical protein H4219_001318 [Mycoemilia scoparia]
MPHSIHTRTPPVIDTQPTPSVAHRLSRSFSRSAKSLLSKIPSRDEMAKKTNSSRNFAVDIGNRPSPICTDVSRTTNDPKSVNIYHQQNKQENKRRLDRRSSIGSSPSTGVLSPMSGTTLNSTSNNIFIAKRYSKSDHSASGQNLWEGQTSLHHDHKSNQATYTDLHGSKQNKTSLAQHLGSINDSGAGTKDASAMSDIERQTQAHKGRDIESDPSGECDAAQTDNGHSDRERGREKKTMCGSGQESVQDGNFHCNGQVGPEVTGIDTKKVDKPFVAASLGTQSHKTGITKFPSGPSHCHHNSQQLHLRPSDQLKRNSGDDFCSFSLPSHFSRLSLSQKALCEQLAHTLHPLNPSSYSQPNFDTTASAPNTENTASTARYYWLPPFPPSPDYMRPHSPVKVKRRGKLGRVFDRLSGGMVGGGRKKRSMSLMFPEEVDRMLENGGGPDPALNLHKLMMMQDPLWRFRYEVDPTERTPHPDFPSIKARHGQLTPPPQLHTNSESISVVDNDGSSIGFSKTAPASANHTPIEPVNNISVLMVNDIERSSSSRSKRRPRVGSLFGVIRESLATPKQAESDGNDKGPEIMKPHEQSLNKGPDENSPFSYSNKHSNDYAFGINSLGYLPDSINGSPYVGNNGSFLSSNIGDESVMKVTDASDIAGKGKVYRSSRLTNTSDITDSDYGNFVRRHTSGNLSGAFPGLDSLNPRAKRSFRKRSASLSHKSSQISEQGAAQFNYDIPPRNQIGTQGVSPSRNSLRTVGSESDNSAHNTLVSSSGGSNVDSRQHYISTLPPPPPIPEHLASINNDLANRNRPHDGRQDLEPAQAQPQTDHEYSRSDTPKSGLRGHRKSRSIVESFVQDVLNRQKMALEQDQNGSGIAELPATDHNPENEQQRNSGSSTNITDPIRFGPQRKKSLLEKLKKIGRSKSEPRFTSRMIPPGTASGLLSVIRSSNPSKVVSSISRHYINFQGRDSPPQAKNKKSTPSSGHDQIPSDVNPQSTKINSKSCPLSEVPAEILSGTDPELVPNESRPSMGDIRTQVSQILGEFPNIDESYPERNPRRHTVTGIPTPFADHQQHLDDHDFSNDIYSQVQRQQHPNQTTTSAENENTSTSVDHGDQYNQIVLDSVKSKNNNKQTNRGSIGQSDIVHRAQPEGKTMLQNDSPAMRDEQQHFSRTATFSNETFATSLRTMTTFKTALTHQGERHDLVNTRSRLSLNLKQGIEAERPNESVVENDLQSTPMVHQTTEFNNVRPIPPTMLDNNKPSGTLTDSSIRRLSRADSSGIFPADEEWEAEKAISITDKPFQRSSDKGKARDQAEPDTIQHTKNSTGAVGARSSSSSSSSNNSGSGEQLIIPPGADPRNIIYDSKSQFGQTSSSPLYSIQQVQTTTTALPGTPRYINQGGNSIGLPHDQTYMGRRTQRSQSDAIHNYRSQPMHDSLEAVIKEPRAQRQTVTLGGALIPTPFEASGNVTEAAESDNRNSSLFERLQLDTPTTPFSKSRPPWHLSEPDRNTNNTPMSDEAVFGGSRQFTSHMQNLQSARRNSETVIHSPRPIHNNTINNSPLLGQQAPKLYSVTNSDPSLTQGHLKYKITAKNMLVHEPIRTVEDLDRQIRMRRQPGSRATTRDLEQWKYRISLLNKTPTKNNISDAATTAYPLFRGPRHSYDHTEKHPINGIKNHPEQTSIPFSYTYQPSEDYPTLPGSLKNSTPTRPSAQESPKSPQHSIISRKDPNTTLANTRAVHKRRFTLSMLNPFTILQKSTSGLLKNSKKGHTNSSSTATPSNQIAPPTPPKDAKRNLEVGYRPEEGDMRLSVGYHDDSAKRSNRAVSEALSLSNSIVSQPLPKTQVLETLTGSFPNPPTGQPQASLVENLPLYPDNADIGEIIKALPLDVWKNECFIRIKRQLGNGEPISEQQVQDAIQEAMFVDDSLNEEQRSILYSLWIVLEKEPGYIPPLILDQYMNGNEEPLNEFFNALMKCEEPDEVFNGSLADTNELYLKLAGSAASIRAKASNEDKEVSKQPEEIDDGNQKEIYGKRTEANKEQTTEYQSPEKEDSLFDEPQQKEKEVHQEADQVVQHNPDSLGKETGNNQAVVYKYSDTGIHEGEGHDSETANTEPDRQKLNPETRYEKAQEESIKAMVLHSDYNPHNTKTEANENDGNQNSASVKEIPTLSPAIEGSNSQVKNGEETRSPSITASHTSPTSDSNPKTISSASLNQRYDEFVKHSGGMAEAYSINNESHGYDAGIAAPADALVQEGVDETQNMTMTQERLDDEESIPERDHVDYQTLRSLQSMSEASAKQEGHEAEPTLENDNISPDVAKDNDVYYVQEANTDIIDPPVVIRYSNTEESVNHYTKAFADSYVSSNALRTAQAPDTDHQRKDKPASVNREGRHKQRIVDPAGELEQVYADKRRNALKGKPIKKSHRDTQLAKILEARKQALKKPSDQNLGKKDGRQEQRRNINNSVEVSSSLAWSIQQRNRSQAHVDPQRRANIARLIVLEGLLQRHELDNRRIQAEFLPRSRVSVSRAEQQAALGIDSYVDSAASSNGESSQCNSEISGNTRSISATNGDDMLIAENQPYNSLSTIQSDPNIHSCMKNPIHILKRLLATKKGPAGIRQHRPGNDNEENVESAGEASTSVSSGHSEVELAPQTSLPPAPIVTTTPAPITRSEQHQRQDGGAQSQRLDRSRDADNNEMDLEPTVSSLELEIKLLTRQLDLKRTELMRKKRVESSQPENTVSTRPEAHPNQDSEALGNRNAIDDSARQETDQQGPNRYQQQIAHNSEFGEINPSTTELQESRYSMAIESSLSSLIHPSRKELKNHLYTGMTRIPSHRMNTTLSLLNAKYATGRTNA